MAKVTSSWRERRSCHPADTLLRKWGFQIAYRIRDQEAVWSLFGVRYTQSDALKLVEEFEKGNVP